jgi:hypothetical protein
MDELFGSNLLCEEFSALVTMGKHSPFLSVSHGCHAEDALLCFACAHSG